MSTGSEGRAQHAAWLQLDCLMKLATRLSILHIACRC